MRLIGLASLALLAKRMGACSSLTGVWGRRPVVGVKQIVGWVEVLLGVKGVFLCFRQLYVFRLY